MTKSLPSIIALGVAAAARGDGPAASTTPARRPDGPTTEELEATTARFVREHYVPRRSTGGKKPRRGSVRRSLRSSSNHRDRNGKDSKGGKDSHYSYSKSGKTGKSEDPWGPDELFYLLPTACPNECISSRVSGEHNEFIDSLRTCAHDEETQRWLVRSDGSYITIESYHEQGMCIAVDFERGDDAEMLANTCYNGELVLKPCYAEDDMYYDDDLDDDEDDDDEDDTDASSRRGRRLGPTDRETHETSHGVEWYFTGGQLVNSLCWGAGLSSVMTVFFATDDMIVNECRKDVAVWGANDEAVLKADTFMFVNRLPNSPVRIDDVDGAIGGRRG